MLEYLPKEILDGIAAGERRAEKRRTRLRLHLGEGVFPLLRLWEGGFAVEARHLTTLRGLVDIHDGSRHLIQCLIIASSVEGDELICEFKRATPVMDRAAMDYWHDESRPVALLTYN